MQRSQKPSPYRLKQRLINANKNSGYIAAPNFSDMEYNRIVAVTGLPGLFEVLSSKADGAIVRSLEDGSTKFVSSRVHNLSHLESIEIYTVRENVSLADVFTAMKGSSEALPDVKDNKALKGYFEKVYPDLDFDRVYTSDMKKMVKWYEVVDKQNIDFTAKEQPAEEEDAEVEDTVENEAPAKKKTASKKAAATTEEGDGEDKKAPAKKTAAKKTAKAETDGDAATEEKPKRTRKKKEEE
jgi:hypothetical protein